MEKSVKEQTQIKKMPTQRRKMVQSLPAKERDQVE